VIAKRIRREDSNIILLSYEDSMKYWYRGAGPEDECEVTFIPSAERWGSLDVLNYPLPKRFRLHFANAGSEDRARSEEIFNTIEERLNRDMWRMNRIALSDIKMLIQTRPPSDSSPQRQSLHIRDMNMTVRNLLTMIPPDQWPRPGPHLSCLNPHCNQCIEATDSHLRKHSESFGDGLFHDPLIATLSGLIG
jgi:hypothetical protein